MLKMNVTAVLALVLLLTGMVTAAPAVVEEFNYGDGTLTGSNTGSGWTTAWGSTGTSLDIASGTASDSSTANGTLSNIRGFDTSQFSYGSGAIWTSVKVNVGAETDAGVSSFIPFANGTSSSAQWNGIRMYGGENDAFGNPTYSWAIYWNSSSGFWGGASNDMTLTPGEHLFVIESNMDDNKTYVYLDPDISDPTTAPSHGSGKAVDLFGGGGGTLDSSFQYCHLYSDGLATNTFDDIRYGQSFEDVVVPEPASMTLLGLGGLGVLIRRRRK